MAIRPRTARRIALVGGLFAIVLLGVLGFVVLPKVQNARSVEGFRRNGMQAHEEGRHAEAVSQLGRHVRAMGERPVDPEVLVALARSRAAWEVADGSHVRNAAAMMREYLRSHPDDRAASIDLLDYFARSGGWAEARDLAVRLRPSDIAATPETDLKILRDEAQARTALDSADPLVIELEDRLLAAESPAFVDAWRAFARAEAAGDSDRANAVIDAYEVANPEAIGLAVIKGVFGGKELSAALSVAEIAGSVGIDPQTASWTREVVLDDPEIVRVLVRAFEIAQRVDLTLLVLESALASTDEAEFERSFVRRLFWTNQDDRVVEHAARTPKDGANPDSLGYAALVHLEREESAQAEAIEVRLGQASGYDFRAEGWLKLLEAKRLIVAGDLISARAAAAIASEKYLTEPTFRLIVGDIHRDQSRLDEAAQAWTLASDLADPFVWIEPSDRLVGAYLAGGRSIQAEGEAFRLFQRLWSRFDPQNAYISPNMFDGAVTILRTDAALALTGRRSDRQRVANTLALFNALRRTFTAEAPADFTLWVATLEADLGNADAARAELSTLLESPVDPSMLVRVAEVDRRFGLGLIEPGDAVLPAQPTDPDMTLRAAISFVASGPGERADRVSRAGLLISQGLSGSDASSRAAWLRADAVYKDATEHSDAAQAWRAALDADPENITLLTEASESTALGLDRDFVEQSINRIVELTATQGRTLPARLRLARARATFGRTPTRQERDNAIAIVRAVTIAEPENVAARTMLANMLQFPPSPALASADRYTPDITAAIAEYTAAAALLNGREAFGYLFTAAELHRRNGDEAQARQILLDAFERARGNPGSQAQVVAELSRLSDNETASRLIGEVYAGISGPVKVDLGFLLTQSYLALNDTARAAGVLTELAGAETLTAGQVASLASRFEQVARTEDARRVLDRAEEYGLSPTEAAIVRAGFAATFGDAELAERTLVGAVENDPSAVDAWVRLVRLLLDQGRSEDAAARADEALAIHPDSEDLLYAKQLAIGDPAAAIRVFASRPGVNDDLRLAIERVEAYDARRESLGRDERLTELRSLSQTFPQNAAVIKFVLRERIALNDEASTLAADALAAVDRISGDIDLLRMTAALCFQAGRYADSLRVATQWRRLAQGSQLEPDLFAAQASQMLNDHASVITRLRPYLDDAIRQPDEPVFANAILLHARSELATRGPGVVRPRLEPVAARSEIFRSTVWLDLAATSVGRAQDAADWLEAAESMGMAGNEIPLAQAWMRAAARFPDKAEEFSVNAARISGSLLTSRPDDLPVIVTAAQAFQRWAEAVPSDAASEPFDQAATLFVRAARLEPDNLNHLFSAARCADDAGRPSEAEAHYRALLGSPGATGLFRAAVQNNLAGILSRVNPTPNRLQESLGLANRAIQFQAIAPFLGTRGWTLLGLDRVSDALNDFQQATQADPSSFEAWAGLAAAQKRTPDTESQSENSMARARQLIGDQKPPQELRSRLEPTGLSW